MSIAERVSALRRLASTEARLESPSPASLSKAIDELEIELAAAEHAETNLEERLRIERDAERRARQAQKLESVGRLAAGVAHEINTPVQFVSDSVHFVRDAVSNLVHMLETYRALTRAVIEGGPSLDLARDAAKCDEDMDLAYLLENLPGSLSLTLEGLERIAMIVRSMREVAHPDVDLNRAIERVLARGKHAGAVQADTG